MLSYFSMKKLWAWIKKWWGAVVAALAAIFGGLLLWRRHKRKLGAVKDELAVAEATKEISRLKGVREEVARQVHRDDVAIKAIDDEIKHQKRKVVEAHEVDEGMSDEEVAQAFDDAGY